MEPVSPIEEMPERVTSMMSDGAESVPVILEVKEEKIEERKPVPEISHVTVETVTEAPTTPESDLTDIGETMKSYDKLFESGPEPRLSTQAARPNYDELYEHYYAQYSKPKVKLGPRPRPSLDTQRPSTSGSVPQVHSRPKSSLPPGLRSTTRKAAEARRDKSQDSARTTTTALSVPVPPPIPATPEVPSSPISIAFTAKTAASVRSMPVSAYGSNRAGNMTQEKTRLMKALELRKKQQKVQIERQEKIAEQAAAASQVEAEEAEAAKVNAAAESNNAEASAKGEPDSSLDAAENKTETEYEGSSRDDTSSSVGVEDSGLVYSKSHTDTDDLNSTASISSPISAQTQGSSGAPSTRPSSLSEDDIAAQKESCQPEDVQDAQSSDVVDEEESVDSLPTVVPESRTPIPSLIHSGPYPSEPEQTQVDDAESITETRRQSQAQRRSKRESMLFVPSGDASPLDDGAYKKRNRESIMMPSIPAMPSSKRQSWYETKPKGRAMLDPIQVSAENSEAEYLSDDSFMEELQSATVHEAKPMSVSKSPITPWFPRKTSDMGSVASESRPVSQVYSKSLRGSPEQFKRSTSGPWPPQVNIDAVGVAKKVNVSSGISQRIKALAEKSSRELSPPVTPIGPLDSSSHSLAQRKSSFFAATPIETSPNGRPVSRLGSPAFLNSSSSTPEKRSAGTQQPIKATVYNVQRANTQPESVQVTARIVRDERTKQPVLAMPSQNTPLDLHQSHLIIDHQKPKFTPRSPTRGRVRTEPSSPKASSASHSREQSIAASRTSSDSGWRPFGRRMSESTSIHSHEGEDKRDDKKEKKESRTTKMFKRMSNMSGKPWKNSNSNLTLPEHNTATSLASLREPPPSVHVGDLNIQFPDTLLWKRRWVEIDSMGNLVLSPSKSNEKGIVKRFHLSEFRTPYPPDQDRQELPNSVVLDFIDGRTLQCACETYMAQAHVLQSMYAQFPTLYHYS
jgi:hypothetical protein